MTRQTQQEHIQPKEKYRSIGHNPIVHHFVQQFEDGYQQIFIYKHWSKRWQCWMYETKPAWEYAYMWREE